MSCLIHSNVTISRFMQDLTQWKTSIPAGDRPIAYKFYNETKPYNQQTTIRKFLTIVAIYLLILSDTLLL
jgi:hypothetical protein